MGRAEPLGLFSFDPDAIAPAYRAHGWAHVPGGATPEFCDFVGAQVEALTGRAGLRRDGISVSKEQHVLDLVGAPGVVDELFDAVAVACGLTRTSLTLSERHINVYAADAAERPRPHKDRYASQVSVGISIAVPEESKVVLWPDDDRRVNPLQRAGYAESLPPEEAPEVVLAGTDPVVISDARGDVQLFAGSSMWHTRWNPANTVVLYFKCNDFGSDPLGEDPRSARDGADTGRQSADRDAPTRSVVVLGRAFESVTRERVIGCDEEWCNVNVWGRPPIRISDTEYGVLCELRGERAVDEIAGGRPERVDAMRRLATIGAIELRPSPDG
jgi:hypothetical protein